MQLSKIQKRNPQHQLLIGGRQIDGQELSCIVLGRLVNTTGYSLIFAPSQNGLIYGSKDVLAQVGAENLEPDGALAAISKYVTAMQPVADMAGGDE